MKILLTTDHTPKAVNGVNVSVMNLKKELKSRGEDVRLLCLSPTMKTYKDGDTYLIGSMPFNVYPDVRASFSSYNPLIDELIEWKPDIIHSQCEFFTYTFTQRIARRCKCPIVHTYHTMYEHYVRYLLPVGNWSRIVGPVMRMRLKTADVVIAPTQKVRESLVSQKVTDDIRIIPTGIDLSKYDKDITPERKREILEQLGVPHDAFVMGTVGRIAKEKNLTEVLEALSRLVKREKNVALVITGDGAYRETIEAEVDERGLRDYVFFPGMIPFDRIHEYYRILDVFVCASISETQGLTYIEALSNNLPVVARRDEAIAGVVKDGVNGYRYDTVEEFVEDLERLIQDEELREKLAKGAAESRRQFGLELFGDRVLDLYQEVINRENPPKLQQVKLTARWKTKILHRTSQSDGGRFYATIESNLRRYLHNRRQEMMIDEEQDEKEEA